MSRLHSMHLCLTNVHMITGNFWNLSIHVYVAASLVCTASKRLQLLILFITVLAFERGFRRRRYQSRTRITGERRTAIHPILGF